MIVANPSGNAEHVGLALDEPAEADALHTATDQKTAGLDWLIGHLRRDDACSVPAPEAGSIFGWASSRRSAFSLARPAIPQQMRLPARTAAGRSFAPPEEWLRSG